MPRLTNIDIIATMQREVQANGPCGCTLKVGDQVTVDGQQGRGFIIARNGRDLTIKFQFQGVDKTLVRDQRNVHPLRSDYQNQYTSLAMRGIKAPSMLGYGTSEGVKKERDTRGRGRKNDYSDWKSSPAGNANSGLGGAGNTEGDGLYASKDPELAVAMEAAGTIVKQGALYCVKSGNIQDQNFGCFSSRKEAEDHLRYLHGPRDVDAGKVVRLWPKQFREEERKAGIKPYVEAKAYKLDGRTTFQGMDISIENDKGSTREGVDKNGKPWKVKMTWPYGYIRMSKGVDGDHVDCFIGPNPNAATAYVIHTSEPTTGKFDEDKCMLGFDSPKAAKRAFLENYSDPRFFGGMEAVPMDAFKKKVLATKDNPAKISAASQFGQTGWKYGGNIARSIGYIPSRTTAGFPAGGHGGHPLHRGRAGKAGVVHKIPRPKVPKVPVMKVHHPNPSGHSGMNVRKPNISMPHSTAKPPKAPSYHLPNTSGKTGLNVRKPNMSIPKHRRDGFEGAAIKADIGGEPMTGNMGHVHIDPVVWFHPPSLTKRNSNESTRIPTDDPGEKNDKFMDVTKRNSKDTAEMRMKLLKRSAPGGLPAQIPARTTLVQPHSPGFTPSNVTSFYASTARKRFGRDGINRRVGGGMFTNFANQGRI